MCFRKMSSHIMQYFNVAIMKFTKKQIHILIYILKQTLKMILTKKNDRTCLYNVKIKNPGKEFITCTYIFM
jgi:hypothetical protein